MPSHTAANKPDTALPIPVRALQRLLHMDHFTGHYDDATRNAVRTLQRLKDLPITGEVDAATLAAIRASQPELEAMKRARHCVITTPLSQRDPGCLCEGGLRPLIVIDPGHGRYKDAQGRTVHDSGTLAGQKPEAEINLAVAKKLAANLRAEGFDVQLTRESDTQVLPSRFAARWDVGAGRKVFHISLHCESNPAVRGMVVYYSAFAPKDSPSHALARALSDGNVQPHRTDILNPFVLGNTASALVEMASLAHPGERARMLSSEGQSAMASTLSRRIRNYYNTLQARLSLELPALEKPFSVALRSTDTIVSSPPPSLVIATPPMR